MLARGYNACSRVWTWRACHIASADSRVAITSRRGACGDVIEERVGSATAEWKEGGNDRHDRRRALLAILASAPFALAPAPAQAQAALSTQPGTLRPGIPRSAQLDAARDLSIDGQVSRRERKPILLFFDRLECPYCERALREYLVPLSRENWRDRALFRQIDIDRPLPLVDFDGTPTTHDRVAARYRVRLSPTVIVVSGDGTVLSGPLVGLMSVDFYGAYLERALEDARRKLAG
jgi:hypothetical protein